MIGSADATHTWPHADATRGSLDECSGMTVIAIDRTIEIANEAFEECAAALGNNPFLVEFICVPQHLIDTTKDHIHNGEVYPIIFAEVVAKHDDGTFGGCTAFVHEVSKKVDVCHKGKNNISRGVLDAHLTHGYLVGFC